jgi:type II secretory pathway pseudopilin PulG
MAPRTPTQNRLPPSAATRNRAGEGGFSLLEAVLAIGILATILSQIVSIHAGSLATTQAAISNMKATWAIRAAAAQIQYAAEVYGSSKGIRPEVTQDWGADPNFKIKITNKEVNVQTSQLLLSALRIGKLFAGPSEESEQGSDPMEGIKPMLSQLDGFVPKGLYRQINIDVTWKDGESNRSISDGFFFIDDKTLSGELGGLSQMLNGMGGDMGGMGGGSSGGGSDQTGGK